MTKVFFIYNGDERIEATSETMSGAQIKAAIKAAHPELDPTHELVLEGVGHQEDRVINDGDNVNLAHGHGEGGPKHFFTRPPTNFGA